MHFWRNIGCHLCAKKERVHYTPLSLKNYELTIDCYLSAYFHTADIGAEELAKTCSDKFGIYRRLFLGRLVKGNNFRHFKLPYRIGLRLGVGLKPLLCLTVALSVNLDYFLASVELLSCNKAA